MRFDDRYSTAVRASNLKSDARTTHAPSDVIAAAGMAGKTEALSMALLRLFVGDNRASVEIVAIMSERAWGKAQAIGVKLKRHQAEDMARMVLAWHRDGVCKACHGHGYELIDGAPSLSGQQCKACRGTGKVLFAPQFRRDHVEVAEWLCAEIERESGRAAPLAMRALADQMDF